MNSNIQIRTVQFSDINEWDNLVINSKTATFFQTLDWLRLWIKHFGGNPKIFGVYENNSLIGIAPFNVVDDHIELLGTSPVLGEQLVSDFGDIIAKEGNEKAVWLAIIKTINNLPAGKAGQQLTISNKFVINFIREDSPSLPSLKEMGGKMEENDVAPYVDLPPTWDVYLARLDRHNRHELQRKIRKLEAEGAFKVCYEGEASDIDEFFRLMTLSNEQKRNFLSAKMRSFFHDIFATFLPKKLLTLCFLKLDSKNIAAVMGFTFNKQFLLYNSGFDPSFGKFAPGFILKAYLIKHAIEQSFARFDFLRGNERYKYDLGGRQRKLYTVRLG